MTVLTQHRVLGNEQFGVFGPKARTGRLLISLSAERILFQKAGKRISKQNQSQAPTDKYSSQSILIAQRDRTE